MEDCCTGSTKNNCNKKHKRSRGGRDCSIWPRKKPGRSAVAKKALVDVKSLGVPLISAASGSPSDSITLHPDHPYTIGRSGRYSHFVFDHRSVGRRHCQILFDALLRKLYILDGALYSISGGCLLVHEFRKRLRWVCQKREVEDCSKVRASLNGVFVNGVRVRTGMAVELSAGDEVSLVCGNEGFCCFPIRIGFVIRRIVFEEELFLSDPRPQKQLFEMVTSSSSQSRGSKRVFASKVDAFALSESKCESLIARANSLLS